MAAVTTLGLGKTMEKKLHVVGIRGCEIKQLEDSCKADLKAYFKQL